MITALLYFLSVISVLFVIDFTINTIYSFPTCSPMGSPWLTRMGMCGPALSVEKLLQMQKPKWDIFLTSLIFVFRKRFVLVHKLWPDILFLQANLKRHTETHIKGIPWPCNICGKVSGSKSGLAQHKAKYHKDQEGAMVAVKVSLYHIVN